MANTNPGQWTFHCQCGRTFRLPAQAAAWALHYALTGHRGPRRPRR